MAQKKKTEPVEKIQEEPQKVVPERDDCKMTDYTKWQREYFDRIPSDQLHEEIIAYVKTHPYQGKATEII